MKVLILAPYLPYPLFSGGQVRLYNLIKNLSAKHEITLFSFIRRDEEYQYVDELIKYCRKIEVFKKRRPWTPSTLMKTAFSPYPLLMVMYNFPQFKEKIRQELSGGKYDLIHVECFYAMHNLPPTSLPVVLADQNIEYLVYDRFTKNSGWIILKPLMYLDVAKIKLWEERFWKMAKKLVAMSDEEKKLMDISNVEVVPNGVDVKYFSRKIFKNDKAPTVVFVGNFRWMQNRDALRFLHQDIWPKIKKELPEVKLLVVGRDMPSNLRNSFGDDVAVEDNIDDIREAYQRAHLLLAPVRVGGGTSYKILEAMASSLPVVTTPLGLEGIKAENGKEVVVYKDPSDLAHAAVDLLVNKKTAVEIGKRAQKLIAQNYDWGKISAKLSRIWEEAGGK